MPVAYLSRALCRAAFAVCFTVAAYAGPEIVSSSTASGRVAYDFQYYITSTSTVNSYGASGLPAGLTVDSAKGTVTGRPTQSGVYQATVSATNSTGTTNKAVTITIDPAPTEPPVISAPTSFDSHNHFYYHLNYDILRITGTNYPQSMSATGAPGYVYFDTWGPGLAIDHTNARPGIYHVTVSATNPAGTSTAQFDWFVHAALMEKSFSQPEYNAGDVISFNVHFDAPVVVTGTPRIALPGTWADGQPHYATYASGSGTEYLSFRYQTRSDDFQPTDQGFGAVELNGGAIKDPNTGLDAFLGFVTARIEGPQTYRVLAPPTITSPTTARGTVGVGFRYTIAASNGANQFTADNLPPGLTLQGAEISGVPTLSGTFNVTLRAFNGYRPTPGTAMLTLTIVDSPTGRPTVAVQPATVAAAAGGSATFTTATTSADPSFQWQWNGRLLSGATQAAYTVGKVMPDTVGIYTATISAGGQSTVTNPAILGLLSDAKVLGNGSEVGPNIVHANGNVYDQILLQGPAATVTADRGQIVRVSFVDLNDDVVQVEFSGSGTLTIGLESWSGPQTATNYNQPNVTYMKGHAGIVVTGADETTNLSVFSVGRITAVNQSLFTDADYDGVADIAFIAVQSNVGRMAAVRAANTSFWSTHGLTGLYAPGVAFAGPVRLCDIIATEDATPVILIGQAAEVEIAGGDLSQTNNRAVEIKGFPRLRFIAGATSHGDTLPALANHGRLEQDGVDVTATTAVSPP